MASFPKALPHGPLTEVFPDVFLVIGGFRVGPGARITRNMTVVRSGGELVILNSVRLTDEGEAQLAKLGKVAHVVRLGSFHGADDPYYADRYKVPIWGPPGIMHAPGIGETRELKPGSSPLDGATVFVFEQCNRAEAAVLLARDGGVLITCDSFQHWTTFDGCSLVGKMILRMMRFGPAFIGPMWLKAMGPSVRGELERMAALPFRHLLAGHGAVLRDNAADELRGAIAKQCK